MKMSELVAVLRDIKSKYGDIPVIINNDNVIESIIVIEKTSGKVVTLSGSKTRLHPIIAQGTTIRRCPYYQEF